MPFSLQENYNNLTTHGQVREAHMRTIKHLLNKGPSKSAQRGDHRSIKVVTLTPDKIKELFPNDSARLPTTIQESLEHFSKDWNQRVSYRNSLRAYERSQTKKGHYIDYTMRDMNNGALLLMRVHDKASTNFPLEISRASENAAATMGKPNIDNGNEIAPS